MRSRTETESSLSKLLEHPGIQGAVLASRDGLALVVRCPGISSPEVFCAMHAAALGAAEMAMEAGGPLPSVGLVVELGPRRFLSRAVTEDLIVIVLTDATCDWQSAFHAMDAAWAPPAPA